MPTSNTNVFFQRDGSVSRAFGSVATPQAFLLSGTAVIARGVPNKPADLEQLAARYAKGGGVQPVLSQTAK